jgi:hypothetical protein
MPAMPNATSWAADTEVRAVRFDPPPVGPVEELLVGYRRYLLEERGVKASTVARYEHEARVFCPSLRVWRSLGWGG